MSGAHRLAASELVSGKYKNLKGEEYLKAVDMEMNESYEGSKEDIAEDKKEGVTLDVKSI
jgi:hypothetical protein